MKIEEFLQYMESRNNYGEYIVRIAYKYAHEKTWTITNEYLSYNFEFDMWEWQNDWHEGQEYVEVLGYIRVDDITEMTERWGLK